MEVNEIVEHIFGPKCRLPDHPQELIDEKLYCLDWINQWVTKTLIELGGPCTTPEVEDLRDGRIGPRIVRFDITTHVGLFIVGADRLSLHSQSNFSTIRANVCLYKGKWQYEIQLGSKGVMQIGWATSGCKFSQEIGVGDTINSYAYDGNRIRKWNVSTYKYGEPWLSGDIIGCTIDLDRGSLEFYRNGRSMGEAFDNIQMGPGMAYFPSVSLAFTENLVANFGATPLRYPIEGFEPIQEAPINDFVKADQLTKWLLQLLNLYDRKYEVKRVSYKSRGLFSHIHSSKNSTAGPSSNTSEVISHQALLISLSRVLIHPLATLLLSPYVTEACLVPFLQNICGVENTQDGRLLVANKRKLMVFLDMLWAFLEEFEIQRCLEALIACLLSNFRHVSFELEYPHQKKSLLLLTYLTQHSKTRKHLLEHVLFDKVRFANFVHVKPLDEGGLAEVVNTPWWEPINDEKVKQAYNSSCQRIKEAIAHIETLQVELLKTLLDNTDGSPSSPSSRKIFLRKFRLFLHEHAVSSRALPMMQTPLPITLCCFHRLLVTFRALWEKEVCRYPIVIPSKIFYDSSVNYCNIDRLGGVLSHLNKTLKTDLIRALGQDHPTILALDKPPAPIHHHDLDASSFLAGTSLSLGPRFHMASTSSTGASTSTNGTSQTISTTIATSTTTTNTVTNPTPLATAAAAAANAPPTSTVSTTEVAANTSTTSTTATSQPNASQIGTTLNVSTAIGMVVERLPDRIDSTRTKAGALDAEMSLVELLDGLIMFYHICAHKQIAKVSMLRDSMAEYIAALTDTRSRLDTYQSTSTSDRIAEELERACNVFEEKLSEQSRHMAWVRAAVYSADKQSHLAWLLRVVLQSVKLSSLDGQLFSYLPDFYLDALVELCTAIRSYVHPTAPIENIEGYEDLLIEVSEFLCEHFADPRIVHANSKDTMIQALANFVCAQNTLHALEKVPYASRLSMVRALLRPYENRAWAQSNWVLVRVWQGCGFGFRYHRSPHLARKLGPKLLHNDTSLISQSIKPCPSPLFQSHVKELMLSDEPLASAFLNSLLNQLNWAFSEFIGMLQEIQNVSNRPERVFIESRQLKICATCFDLALALLRVLEMVASISRPIFSDSERPSSELLLSRLCQLLCQVLNRVSSQSGCFQHVVLLEIPDLETVDHFPILTAVIGILLALLGPEIDQYKEGMEEVPQVAKALLTEPSFQLSSLYFVLGDLKKIGYSRINKPFSFYNYTDDVNEYEIDRVQRMLQLLEACQTHLSESKTLSEDETCTICYAYPNEAIFKPCNHQSCRSCIAHHLMNSRDCFFCKTPIVSVIDESGNVLHNLEKSNLSTNV